MTYEEAVKIISSHITIHNGDISGFSDTVQESIREDREAFKMAISALERDRWIPVTERLPENAYHKGALCDRCYISTKYGVTEGWYNPDIGSWYDSALVQVWIL